MKRASRALILVVVGSVLSNCVWRPEAEVFWVAAVGLSLRSKPWDFSWFTFQPRATAGIGLTKIRVKRPGSCSSELRPNCLIRITKLTSQKGCRTQDQIFETSAGPASLCQIYNAANPCDVCVCGVGGNSVSKLSIDRRVPTRMPRFRLLTDPFLTQSFRPWLAQPQKRKQQSN